MKFLSLMFLLLTLAFALPAISQDDTQEDDVEDFTEEIERQNEKELELDRQNQEDPDYDSFDQDEYNKNVDPQVKRNSQEGDL